MSASVSSFHYLYLVFFGSDGKIDRAAWLFRGFGAVNEEHPGRFFIDKFSQAVSSVSLLIKATY